MLARAVERARGVERRTALAMLRPWLLSLFAGAVVALALPPFELWPLLAAFAPLVLEVRRAPTRRQAFLLGWCFGLGHFLVGLYWIAIAFFADAERFGLLAVPAVVLLSVALAVLPGLATLALRAAEIRSLPAAALTFALTWTIAEALRAQLFPWNLIGYGWIGTPVAQLGAVTGIYGLSLLAVLIGALPVVLQAGAGERSWRPLAAGLIGLAIVWTGGSWRLGHHEPGSVVGARLRLVQGNVAQHHKWQPELRARWFQRHLDLSISGSGAPAPTDIIWPESATPYAIESEPLVRQRIAEVIPPGGLLITGAERFDLESDPARAWNSLFVIDRRGRVLTNYDKHQLVPFGEYLPFRTVLGALGLGKLTPGSMDFQPGSGPAVLELPNLPPVSPLICYEVIFSGEIVPAAERPAWLLNITNDAWFGTSSGPYQHLAMARMRSIEEGLPLVRSANTGISAVIGPLGEVRALLGLNEMGVLDADLPAPVAPTLFARFGHLGAILGGALCLVVACGIEFRARRRRNG